MNFYTNCTQIGNYICLREYANGKKNERKIKYRPSLFLPSKLSNSEYKTIYNEPLIRQQFSSIYDAKQFIKEHEGLENFKIYGNKSFNYTFISDEYGDNLKYDIDKIDVCYIDIETGSESGFPDPNTVTEPIISITLFQGGKYYVYGCGDYEKHRDDVFYFKCKNELELLEKFIDKWEYLRPDIITGWNTNFFDIPYIINRCSKLFGDEFIKRLSPWGWIKNRIAIVMGREHTVFDLVGISNLDYLEIYKKFIPGGKESYTLNYIASVELGEEKINYDEYGSLHTLYQRDYQKFIEYNIKDVELVYKLEQKLKLINMVIATAYDARVNFNDTLSQVRMWDTIIFNELKRNKMVVPQKQRNEKTKAYEGAYVKEPIPNLYKWIASFDLDSLYPHLIAQYNISPDTICEGEYMNLTVDKLLHKKYDLEILKDKNMTVAANGHMFTLNKQGFLPRILMKLYSDRKEAKHKMLIAKEHLEKVRNEIEKR